MPDRRDLRFWLPQSIVVWLIGILAALFFLVFAFLFGPYTGQNTDLRTPLCLWLCTNVMVSVISVASGMRLYIPLTLTFGATRRSTALIARLAHILPILLTMLTLLALGCIEALRISPMTISVISSIALALCGLGDLVAVLSLNHRFWIRISLLFCGLAGGVFGGILATSLSSSSMSLFNLMIDLTPSPIDAAVIAVSLIVAGAANLTSALMLRRVSVQF